MFQKMKDMSMACYRPEVGLLLIRLATGSIFIHHGWSKVGNITGVEGMMVNIGLPAFMAYAIAFVEVVGGAMLVLGVLARAAGVATGIAMIVAVVLAVYPKRGLGGSEFEILLMCTSFGIAFAGAGKYRLFHLFEHDGDTNAVAPGVSA